MERYPPTRESGWYGFAMDEHGWARGLARAGVVAVWILVVGIIATGFWDDAVYELYDHLQRPPPRSFTSSIVKSVVLLAVTAGIIVFFWPAIRSRMSALLARRQPLRPTMDQAPPVAPPISQPARDTPSALTIPSGIPDSFAHTAAPPPATEFHENGLYLADIKVDLRKAEEERVIEVLLIAFNATGQTIKLRPISGNARFGIMGGGTSKLVGDLPPPRPMTERTPLDQVQNLSEFRIHLEQRVTKQFVEALTMTGPSSFPYIDFEKLQICGSALPFLVPAYLPLWSGIRLYRDETQVLVGRIISAKLTNTLKAGIS